ncbi:MAG: hypothetical protein KAW93_02450 [Methanogenium sp.]|nr:hypothetical protein [Methanogenium sp.]
MDYEDGYIPSGKSKQVLIILGTGGPCAAYTIFKKHGVPTATVQKAINDLKEKGLIECSNTEKGLTGKIKKLYSVTMLGFCLAYTQMYKSLGEYENYDSLKSLILNNSDIFPLISNKWNYLVSPDHPFERSYTPVTVAKYRTIEMVAMKMAAERIDHDNPLEAWWYGTLYEVFKRQIGVSIPIVPIGLTDETCNLANKTVLYGILEIICDYPHNPYFDSLMAVLKKDSDLWDISKKVIGYNYMISEISFLKYKEYVDPYYIDLD